MINAQLLLESQDTQGADSYCLTSLWVPAAAICFLLHCEDTKAGDYYIFAILQGVRSELGNMNWFHALLLAIMAIICGGNS